MGGIKGYCSVLAWSCTPSPSFCFFWVPKVSSFPISYLLATLFRILPLFCNNIDWWKLVAALHTKHSMFFPKSVMLY